MKTVRFLTLLPALLITAAMVFAIPAVISSAEDPVIEVYHNGATEATLYDNFSIGWKAAIHITQKVAQPQSSFLPTALQKTAASAPATAFSDGAIYIHEGKTITLDLNAIPLTEGCHLP